MTKSLLLRVENKRGRICETGPTDRSIFPSPYCEFFGIFGIRRDSLLRVVFILERLHFSFGSVVLSCM